MSKPRSRDGDKRVWWEDPEKLKRLYDYCKQDVRTELALSQCIPPLSELELKTYRLDQIVNDRGLNVDMELVEASQVMVAAADKRINAKLNDITGIAGTTAIGEIRSWIESRGVQCDSLCKDSVASLLKQEIPNDVRKVLELRKEGAKTSTAKLTAYEKAVCADGKLRGMFLYHGAGTGRWSGRLVQLQNLMSEISCTKRSLRPRQSGR